LVWSSDIRSNINIVGRAFGIRFAFWHSFVLFFVTAILVGLNKVQRTWDVHPLLTHSEFERLLGGTYVFTSIELHCCDGTEAKGIAANAWLFALSAIFAFFRVAQLHTCMLSV
jgi:hypothetical protein